MGKHEYILVNNQPLSPTSRLITLKSLDSNQPMLFLPGQYAGLSFRENDVPSPVRCFSIASSPDQKYTLEFGIRVNGNFTGTIADLPHNAPVTVYGPFGSFTFPEDTSRPLVMIAGGIGITPFISMIRYAANHELPMPITLIYSNKSRQDIPYLEELRKLAAEYPRFSYKVFVTQDAAQTELGPEPDIAYGRVDVNAIATLCAPRITSSNYMICGPGSFMQAMTGLLQNLTVPEDSIVIESFGQAVNSRKDSASPQLAVNVSTLVILAFIFFVIAAADMAKKSALPSASAVTTTQNAEASPSPSPSYVTPSPSYSPSPTDVQYYQPIQQPRTSVS